MLIFLPLLLALIPQKAPPAPDAVWPDALVAKTYPAQAGCGMFKFWSAVDFAHDGMTDRVYFECKMAEELPRVGTHCAVSTYIRTIDAISSDGRQTPFEARVVEKMMCARRQSYRGATITSYGKTPSVDSGSLFVFLRRATVTTAEGATRTLYFFHGHGNEFLNHAGWDTYPAIGSVCDFSVVIHDFRHGNFMRERDGDGEGDDNPEGEVIENAACKR
jgi:hypothetical protein